MTKKYHEITVISEVNKKINTLNKTRDNRIKLSLRLKTYNDQWSLVFFFLNIEAVIFVFLSLSGETISENNPTSIFTIISGIYSIYVILTQYYVSQLKYSERSLKAHYHQLEIEDLILDLKNIILIKDQDEKSVLRFNNIMREYQTVLKNNENHDPIDNENRLIDEMNILAAETSVSNGKEKKRDFTADNFILSLNKLLIVVIPVIMYLTF